MREQWAFLDSGLQDAAMNMAIDEALLDWHSDNLIPPVIRFYGWENPTLSVGHFQNAQKTINFDGVKAHQCAFVRRLTGGSAVLHDHELTYSIIVNEAHPKIPSSINQAYHVLAEGLLEGYRMIGVDAAFAKPQLDPRLNRSRVCFESPAIYEILANGKKICGNAQTRKKGVLLQHGSLPISYHVDMLFDLFKFPSTKIKTRQKSRFLDKATSIQAETNDIYAYDSLLKVFLKGFQRKLNITTEPFHFPEALWDHARYLRDTKYSSKSWNEQRKQTMRSV